MAKAVVYALLATAFVIFIVFAPANPSIPLNHPGINRRLGSRFGLTTFDPLVIKIQRYAEEKKGDDHHQHDNLIDDDDNNNNNNNSGFAKDYEIEDAPQYPGEEGRLNITLRLITLFPLLDQAPKDDVVSAWELRSWITEQAVERLNYTTQKELASYDKNGDGVISFGEYLPQFSDEDIGICIYL